ncbi:MAG: hypothetical protein ACD_31C00002G0002 [uncultured bacterium]|uniref:Uncharacterized protein n=1 Tax=Candidatus Daviesbacteria bacterium GW2011_GWB1_36_5 TaxID=1618426 RepID=A0A0G0F7S8_9BACT|nr:MAG: hypothetical protein ACD_31C00002G0002 [uncultured bacterium]KKQ09545.1 MAG: hypothetical protein US19_C0013G0019 [Candidatus Daviesbacteria bacterium GW2011_GWB1_36_5]
MTERGSSEKSIFNQIKKQEQPANEPFICKDSFGNYFAVSENLSSAF